jgi:hypothetical protein
MFSCGRNDFGQLGHGDTTDRRTPQLIPGNISDATQLSCGQFHSAFVTKQNIVYVCGKNDYGQLGFEGLDSLKVFTKLNIPRIDTDIITQVCCGYYHTLLLSSNGLVFGFGRNDYGQLGLGHVQPRVHLCTPISSLRDKSVTRVSAGCYHSIVVTSNSMLYVFGRNNHGQLGSGDLEERHSPHPVDEFLGKRILCIAAGFYHTVVLVSHESVSSGPEEPDFANSAPPSPTSKRFPKPGFTSVSTLVENRTAPIDDASIASMSFDHQDSHLLSLTDEANPVALFFKELASYETKSNNRLTLPRQLFSQLSALGVKDFLHYLSENLFSFVSQCSSVLPDLPSSKEAVTSIAIHDYHILIKSMRIFSVLLEICRSVISDSSEVDFPLTAKHASQMLRTLLISIKVFLNQHGEKLKFVQLSSTTTMESNKNSLEEIDVDLSPISDLLTRPQAQFTSASDIFHELCLILSDSAQSTAGSNEQSTIELRMILRESISHFRQELFSLYFYLPYDTSMTSGLFNGVMSVNKSSMSVSSSSHLGLMSPFQNIPPAMVTMSANYISNIVELTGSIISKNVEVLFPSLTQSSQLFKVIASQLINITAANRASEENLHDSMGSFDMDFEPLIDYSRCLRLFSSLCFRYRGINDVIDFFRGSKTHGLFIFQQLLNVYSSLSMIFLETKSWPLMNATANEVHRALGLLDHCNANFSKIAIPVILALSRDDKDAQRIGMQICKEILSSAETVIQFLSDQHVYDDFTTILRNTTVLPTVLPTFLLYSIASCSRVESSSMANVLAIVNDIQSLSSTLLLIGKSIADNDILIGKSPSSVKNTPDQSLNSTLNDLQSALAAGASLSQPSAPMNASPYGILATGITTKKESNVPQLAWWTKLLKLNIILISKVSSLTMQRLPMTVSQPDIQDIAALTKHDIWYYHFALSSSSVSSTYHQTIVYEYQASWSRATVSILREREMIKDGGYKAIITSARNSKVSAILESIEAIMFDLAVINLLDSSKSYHSNKDISRYRAVQRIWSEVIAYVKFIYSKRSQWLTDGSITWPQVLEQLETLVTHIGLILSAQSSRIEYSYENPVLIKRNSDKRCHQLWRKALLTVFGFVRWRYALRRKLSLVGSTALNFIEKSVSCMTSAYTATSSESWSTNWIGLQNIILTQTENSSEFSQGVKLFESVVDQCPYVSMKSDAVSILLSSWNKRNQSSSNSTDDRTTRLSSYMDMCTTVAISRNQRSAFKELQSTLLSIVSEFIQSNPVTSTQASISDLILLTSSIGFLHRIFLDSQNDPFASNPLDLMLLVQLLLILDEKSYVELQSNNDSTPTVKGYISALQIPYLQSFSTIHQTLISMLESSKYESAIVLSTKPSAKKPSSRERNRALRRASLTVISYLQDIVLQLFSAGSTNCSMQNHQLIDTSFWLCNYLQMARLTSLRGANDSDAIGGLNNGSCSGNNLNDGSKSKDLNSNSSNKRRYQDLITKPTDFNRSQEGMVIQGDKLINSYKGVDFTLATWLFLTKRSSKVSFITGKVSHNDAWPLILLRPDMKLEVLYGHGNDLDRFSSISTISLMSWTHISVVVEQKKIKLFVNGILDSQVSTTKGNARAILYPVLIGVCPQSVRTRVEFVREGFDGILASYKYYTRALSPIHVKVVFDQGPPESNDVREKWMYRMLAAIQVFSRSKHQLCDQSFLHRASETALFIMMTESSSSRLRCTAIRNLQNLFSKEVNIYELSLPNNAGSSVSKYSTSLPLSNCSFLLAYNSPHEKMIGYFLRVLGACCSPHLSLASELDDGNISLLASLDVKSPYPAESESDFSLFREFLHYIPSVLVNKSSAIRGQASPRSSEDATNGNLGANATSSKAPGRQDVIQELMIHIYRLIESLSQSQVWQEALSVVLRSILIKSRAVFQNQSSWTSLSRLDLLGATVFLGGIPSGAFVGEDVSNKYSEQICRVLSTNKSSNAYTVLTSSVDNKRNVLFVLRGSDLNGLTSSIRSFKYANESVMVEILHVMRSLHGYLRLTLHDGLFNPSMSALDDSQSIAATLTSARGGNSDHPFLRHVVLRYIRPLESYYYHQLLSFVQGLVSGSNSSLKDQFTDVLKNHPENYQFLITSACAVTRLYSNTFLPNESNSSNASDRKNGLSSKSTTPRGTTPRSMTADRKSLSQHSDVTESLMPIFDLLGRSVKFLVAVPERSMTIDLSESDTDKLLIDYLNKSLGLSFNGIPPASQGEKLMKRGMIREAIFSQQLESSPFPEVTYVVSNWSTATATGAGIINTGASRTPITPLGRFQTASSTDQTSAASGSTTTTTSQISNQKLALSDLDETDRINTLKFISYTRHNIIVLSRSLIQYLPMTLQIPLRDFMQIPRQFVLWQSLISMGSGSKYDRSTAMFAADHIFKSLTSSISSKTSIIALFEHQLQHLAFSFLEQDQYKNSYSFLESSDLFTRAIQSAYFLISSAESPEDEVLIAHELVRILVNNFKYVEGCEVHMTMMRLCRYCLRRIFYLQTTNDLLVRHIPVSTWRQVNNHSSRSLWSRTTELLAKEKGHVHVNSKVDEDNAITFAYQLAQIMAGMAMIQRTFTHRSLLKSSANAATTLASTQHPSAMIITTFLSQQLSSTSPQAHALSLPLQTKSLPTLMIDSITPVISDIRSSSVSVNISETISDLIEKISNAASNLSTSANISAADITTAISSIAEYIIVELAIASLVDEESPVYETIYTGCSTTLSHSGLIPNCAYLLKARASIGGVYCQWSQPVSFHTESGVAFKFDPLQSGPDITVSSDGLTAKYSGDDNWSTLLCSHGFSTGMVSWEMRVNHSLTAYIFVGIASSAADLTTFLGGDSHGYGFIGEQALYHNREKVKIFGESFGAGDVIRVTVDFNAGTLSFSKNGHLLGVAFDKIFGEFYPAVAFYNVGQEIEILPDKFTASAPREVVPCSQSSLNMNDISILSELIFGIQTRTSFSHRMLESLTSSLEDWCSGSVMRCKSFTGKYVFLALQSLLMLKLGFQIGERVRTPYGVAEVAGVAYNRIWFRFILATNSSQGVWYFSEHQIAAGRERGYFLRCTYSPQLASARSPKLLTKDMIDGLTRSSTSQPTSSHQLSIISTSSMRNLHFHRESSGSGNDLMNESSKTINNAMTFDAGTLGDLIDSNRWSKEMDAVLVNFLLQKAESLGISPWNIPSDRIVDDFRGLQQSLSKIVLADMELSHRWGIAGPKRRAVIARLGVLRLLNHLLEQYLAVLLNDELALEKYDNIRYLRQQSTHSNCLFGMKEQALMGDEPYPIIISTAKSALSESALVAANYVPRQSNSSIIISSSLAPLSTTQILSLSSLACIRHHIFNELKMSHFWDIVLRSTGRPSKTDDDYEYPEELPQVRINRLRSFRAREAAELLHIPGEDLYLSSMFCQLWHELRKHPQENLRISYTHPMDDGQSRSFKVKFDGEGVDDYGGPYREILQQICDELQFPDPSINQQKVDFHRASARVATDINIPTRCFVPILFPTPNWNIDSDEIVEKYKHMFHPASTSAVRLDLYRFLGQVVGIAIRSKLTLDLSLPSIIWKSAVREILSEEDIKSYDHTSYLFIKHLRQLIQRKKYHCTSSADDSMMVAIDQEIHLFLQDITWTCPRSDGKVIQLIPNGRNIQVTAATLETFLISYIEAKLSESQQAMTSFRIGLLSIIPNNALTLLTGEELERIVCGSREIDINRLRENTEYDDDISAEDFHISNFWDVLSNDFNEAEKSAFLRFVWARPTLPPKDIDFPQKFKIQSAVGEDSHMKPDQYMPKAHTCFFSLNLPRYSSREVSSNLVTLAALLLVLMIMLFCRSWRRNYAMRYSTVRKWMLISD